jgi:hypothetical protein
MNAYVGHVPGQTLRSMFRFVSLDGQQVFAGRDANGNVLNYPVGPNTMIIVGGATLSPPDYTATDGSVITLARPQPAGREVLVYADPLVSPADTYPRGIADTTFTRKRNRIVDPGMRVSQENGGNLLTLANGVATWASDSVIAQRGGATGGATVQRIAAPTPGGSPYRQRVTITAANPSPGATDLLRLMTKLEGLDIADFAFGTASAKTVTLRFGVLCTVPGTYGFRLGRGSNPDRSFVGKFTISPAEVGQSVVKSFVIPGDVAGSFATDNTIALELNITLCTGSNYFGVAGWQAGTFLATADCTNLMATNGAIFDLFDIGLYEGSVLPPFELPEYGEDLRRCQRYWRTISLGSFRQYVSNIARIALPLSPSMRLTPSVTSSFTAQANVGAINISAGVDSIFYEAQYTAGGTGVVDATSITAVLNARL